VGYRESTCRLVSPIGTYIYTEKKADVFLKKNNVNAFNIHLFMKKNKFVKN